MSGFNYNAGRPGQFSQAPGYGYPSQNTPAAPPGMSRPPTMMMPPGVGTAPGMGQGQAQQQNNFANMQMPANMPSNLNFNAPVIRLGMSGPPVTGMARPDGPSGGRTQDGGAPRRAGLGYDGNTNDDRRGGRQGMQALAPPSREEIARTILVANITEGVSDEGIQNVLACAGGLRRWTRCMDAESRPCSFGFAEFEDADSLGIACEIFQDVDIPKNKPGTDASNKEHQSNGRVDGDAMNGVVVNGVEPTESGDEEQGPAKAKLHVVVDDESRQYVKDWEGRGATATEDERQFRVDSAKDELSNVLAGLFRPKEAHLGGDSIPSFGQTEQKMDAVTGQIVEIPITIEDELADIPAEMRETVAKEIAAFRDRSIKRDLERLKKEEEMELAEKSRSRIGLPSSAAARPAGGANGIPVGPRDRSGQVPPTGPRGQGVQMPEDFRTGPNFVNGSNNPRPFPQEDEDADESDDEIWQRRIAKRDTETHKRYVDQLRRWENREKNRNSSIQRQKEQDVKETDDRARVKDVRAREMREWNDEEEASRRTHDYYRERGLWVRNRLPFRKNERANDDRDRRIEDREKQQQQEQRDVEMGMADRFLAQQAEEISQTHPSRQEPQRFKLSLGDAAQRVQKASSKQKLDQIEFLLEDDDDVGPVPGQRRQLIPIKFDDAAAMTDEQQKEALSALATEIPSDKDGLWKFPIAWDHLDDAIIAEKLRPFVEKKIVEYLGVQEEMLVQVVEECVRRRASPSELVGELEGALDDEAENLVRKFWRMLAFYTEGEKRGLPI